ncbi:OTU protein [Blastocladiella emersonii ATCC 22665]|nr:OTU protein [Blastocladiella emersonii ATCC 22665]
MEELVATHRKETKALQGQLTALRKQAQANKKQKKELQAQMEQLEADLKARHAREMADLEASLAAVSVSPAEENGADAVAAEQQDASPSPPPSTDQPKNCKKPNRQQLRKQRKHAEVEAMQEAARTEASTMVDHGAIEAERLAALLAARKLKLHKIPADGHCLFNSVAHQLERSGDAGGHGYQSLRALAGQCILRNADEFLPFLVNEETGDLMTEEELQKYVDLIVHTPYWGGHIEIKALAMALERCIHVYQPGAAEPLAVGAEFLKDGAEPLRVCYHRHQFGLGEHYNSLVPQS